jgi:hypothetical protein
MANLDVTKKAEIYQTLSQLNSAFAAIVGHCDTLRQAGALTSRYARRFQAYAQELQAEMNGDVLATMDSVEQTDWARFGRVRDNWEKYLRGPQPKPAKKR